MRIAWTVAVAIVLVGCGDAAPPPEVAAEPGTASESTDLDSLPAPARSTEVLRRAEAAAEAGDWFGAAGLYSAVWEHEFPVDAFFGTLEQSRNEAMANAAGDDDVMQLIHMEALRERVRYLAACPEPFPADLPGEYMVHRLLTFGMEFDPEDELKAADPWRVAIQLWNVRRGYSDVAPNRAAELAVGRYLERPDLWTEAVTGQLWLLAAKADLVEQSGRWPEEIRPSWRSAPAGSGLLAVEVRQWGGGMLHDMPGSTGFFIDGEPATPGWSGRPEPRELAPGTHVVRFLAGQLHSQQIPVDVEPGSCSALVLMAIAGV